MKTSWRRMWMAGALGAAAVGCSTSSLPEPQAVSRTVALQSFSGGNACKDLEAYIEDTAVTQMKSQLEMMAEGTGGFFGGIGLDARAGAAPPQAESADSNKSAAPTDYTQTNNQVAGVDEADFVKNDGTRIFVLSGDTLYASRSWPAEDLSVRGKLKVEGWPQALFLDGTDRAVVFSSIYRWYPLSPGGRGVDCLALECGYYNSNTVKVTVVDVSDLTNLRVTHEYFLPGSYTNGRKVGQSIRLVLTDAFNFPPQLKWYPEYTPTLWNDQARMKQAILDLIPENERLIRAQTLAEWLPPTRVKLGGGSETVIQHDCSDFARVNAPTKLGTLSVVTLNLANPDRLSRTSVIAEWGQVYASARSLYVANPHWYWWPKPGQTDATYLHKFDISQPDRAVYVASGVVEGMINDQFSMDESQAGFFRVATTVSSRVEDSSWGRWGRLETNNRVTVFAENQGVLEAIGKTGDLAKGERIMSARFIENRGYVVTFRQVDPLFAIDLTNPREPKVLGELKIPGFSSYLHPLGENHLIGIGTFVPEPDAQGRQEWRDRAIQLSIFDVTDMKNPIQKHNTLVGNASSWSEAQHEHKAFNYFASQKLLAIPFYSWDWNSRGDFWWSSFVSDLRVFNVDIERGFSLKGAVSMRDMYQVERGNNWAYYWTPAVRRSVMARDDRANTTYVYAISDSGIRVAELERLGVPVATVRFDRYVEK